MTEEMECMCIACGASCYLPKSDILMEDPASNDSKMLNSLLACPICGGQLKLLGRAAEEPFYRLE